MSIQALRGIESHCDMCYLCSKCRTSLVTCAIKFVCTHCRTAIVQERRYHDLPKRTETDFRGYRNGLSEYRNGLSGNRNGPERTETDFRGYRKGLSEYRNGLSGNRNGPERTETDFCEYRNGLCGYRIVIWGVKIDRNTKNRYKLLCQAVQIGYVE